VALPNKNSTGNTIGIISIIRRVWDDTRVDIRGAETAIAIAGFVIN